MSSIWERIRADSEICRPAQIICEFPNLFVVTGMNPEARWVIGPHPALSQMATQLRSSERLCALLSRNKIRMGFRETDCPPRFGIPAQKRYGDMKERTVTDHSRDRKHPITVPVSEIKGLPAEPPPNWRKSDQFSNVESYWATRTPEAHHIVEFNNLKQLGLSTEKGSGELDYDHLPCVLLMAEFHQRYISSALKPTHQNLRATEKLKGIDYLKMNYNALYNYGTFAQAPRPFQSLWRISEIILDAARQKVA